MEPTLTPLIVVFLVFGACFGWATYSNRHLFSEGPSRRSDAGSRSGADSRLMWVLICTPLWPIMALTGALSLWKLARTRARAARKPGR